MTKNIAVFGIYTSRGVAEEAVDSLREAGFRSADVSVLFSESAGTKDLAIEKHTKAPEGAAAGVTTGAVVGGALGWLVSAGILMIPGVGPFMAAGPVVGVLTGIGAGGVFGGIVGSLVGLGVPEYEAKRYEGRIRAGGVLLSVHCDAQEWAERAREILRRTGAEDISSSGEAKADYAVSDRPYERPLHKAAGGGEAPPAEPPEDEPTDKP